MQQSKQLSKQAYAYAWNRLWWLSSIQFSNLLSSSFNVQLSAGEIVCCWL